MIREKIVSLKKIFAKESSDKPEDSVEMNKPLSRRSFLKFTGLAALAGTSAATAATDIVVDETDKELTLVKLKEFFQGNYRLMTEEEKQKTVERFERKAKLQRGTSVNIKSTPAPENTLFGYALNLSRCKGYRDCVQACRDENNLPADGSMDYIRVHELKNGQFSPDGEGTEYVGEVPKDDHFYLPMQCMHCENPPCVPVCPVQATWKEPDGIVVVDYNWCIGCRYCEAACPYWARRFNWSEPSVPNEKINPDQHYLGNRDRMKGVMEKCHFCTHRTREGRMPACQEACPTGARVYGNLLDPNSEIRWILKNKKVFRLKEDLNTEPQFYYYMD